MSNIQEIEVEQDYFRESMEPLYGSDGGIRDTPGHGKSGISTISKQPNETSMGSIRDQARNDALKGANDTTENRRRKQKDLEYQWRKVGCGTAGDSATREWDYLRKTSFCNDYYSNFDNNRLNDHKYIDYMTYWGVRKKCLEKMGFLAD